MRVTSSLTPFRCARAFLGIQPTVDAACAGTLRSPSVLKVSRAFGELETLVLIADYLSEGHTGIARSLRETL